MKHFTLLELVSTHSEMEAERLNAHKFADSLDSKRESEAYLKEFCPHCSVASAFNLPDSEEQEAAMSSTEKRNLEKLGEFCADLASPTLGMFVMIVPPSKVGELIFKTLLLGIRLGRKKATEELTSFGGKVQ